MNINYNIITPKNQSCFSETKNTKITFVEPTINLALLSLIISDKLPQLYDINTLLKFRLINKAFYLNSIDRIATHFCEKKFFDNYAAYSIEAYNRFIKPNLAKSSPNLIASIEEYIQHFSNKYNFKENFSKFLFYKMHHLSEIIPKTFATTKKFILNDFTINTRSRNFIKYFNLSPCGNYCIITDFMKTVTLFEVTAGFDLNRLDVFKFNDIMLTSIISINFTTENNLCIVFSVLNDVEKLVLYQIDFNKFANKHQLNKIAELRLTTLVFAKAIMRCNDTKLILLTEQPYSQLGGNDTTLELWELFENQFRKKCQLDKSIIKITDGNHGYHNVNLIEHLAVNKHANIVAITVGKKFVPKHAICLLTIDDDFQSFTCEKIDKYEQQLRLKEKSDINSYYVQGDLQLAPNGEICIFTNINGFITGLKRNNNTWHKVFTITRGYYSSIKLMPYEKNIMVYREYRAVSNEGTHKDIEIISFAEVNTSNTTEDSSSKVIKPKKYRNYFWQQDAGPGYLDVNLYVHPTGLAAFKLYRGNQYIDIIKIKQPTKLDKLTRIAKIVWQHC